jgi:hypothetical protein
VGRRVWAIEKGERENMKKGKEQTEKCGEF